MSNRRATPPNRPSAAAHASKSTPTLDRHRERPRGVAHVVEAPQRQRHRPERVAAVLDGERTTPPSGVHVDGSEVGVGRGAVGDRVVARVVASSAAKRTIGVVDAEDLRPGDLAR